MDGNDRGVYFKPKVYYTHLFKKWRIERKMNIYYNIVNKMVWRKY